MTNNEEAKKDTKAVVTGRRINPASLMRSKVKTVLRNSPPLKSDHELPMAAEASVESQPIEQAIESVTVKVQEPMVVASAPMVVAPVRVYEPTKEAPKTAEKSKAQEPVARAKPVKNHEPRVQRQENKGPIKVQPLVVAPKIIERPEPLEFDDSGDFGSLLAEMDSIKRVRYNTGDKVLATLVHFNADTAFLALGQKAEASMELAELRDEDGELTCKVGDRVECFVLTGQGGLRLTKKLGRQLVDWNLLESAKNSGLPVEGKIEKTCKGGYDISLAGIRAFCPQGQIDINYSIGQEESWVGKTELFFVTQVSASERNVVVSRRAYLEEIRRQNEVSLLAGLSIGDFIEGTVSRIADFGAFVDINGAEGLVPLSQISHGYVTSASDFVKIGDKVTVQISKIEADPKREGRMRIGLSLKAVMQDPYQEHHDELSAGVNLTGKIVRIEKYGVFVELFPGVDGLVHMSELSQFKGKDAAETLAVGKAIDVRISEVDLSARRISLVLGDRLSSAYESSSGKQQSTGLGTLADIFPRKF